MTAPNHYSRDIAARCQTLIDQLLPIVEHGLPDDHRFGGPLRTTFLLAMATPMIVLPIERITPERDQGFDTIGNCEDVPIDPGQ